MRFRFSPVATALVLMLTAVSPVLAQDATQPQQAQTQTWFQMFFWSDDLIGLLIIWTLLLMSVVVMGYSIHLLLKYRKSSVTPDDSFQQLQQMLSDKRYREAIEFAENDPAFLSQLTHAALAEASNGYASMERSLEEEADAEISRMLRPVEYLNVVGNIAPMLGLFGTVYGMIVAFQVLVAEGGRPDPAKLASGISTALVTTFWGLIVAIPALALYAVIRNKIDALTSEGVLMAEDLIRPFKPGARKAASGTAAPRTRATPKPTA